MTAEIDISDLRDGLDWWSGKRLFFVGGQGKSGTTWVESALNAHPEISCRGEGHLFNGLAMGMDQAFSKYRAELEKNNQLFPDLPGYPLPEPADGVRMMRAMILDSLRAASDDTATAIGERTPGNMARMDLIVRLFPDATFIHVIRDVRDVAVSMWHHKRRLQPAFDRSVGEVAVNIAKVWAPSMDMVSRFGEERFGARYIEVRYEDLSADLAAALTPAVQALGVSDAPDVMEAVAAASSFRAMSGREAGEVDPKSHFRAGVAGAWREAIGEGAADKVWELAGATLLRLGYEK
jgi:hypothetical protein